MRLDIKEVVRMKKKDNCKINYSKIARQYNCDYRTVKAYFERDDNYLKKKRKYTKKTDGFEEIIKDKYLNNHSPANAIYKVLKDNYGYNGSYSTIKRFIASLKSEENKKAVIRFETIPGLQCQIDWKENLKLFNCDGEVFIVNIFLAILGYSRYKFIKLTLDKSQPTLFKCLSELFIYLDGVPKELLFDNMKTVIDRSRTQFNKPIYNDKLFAFSKDANFIPRSCIAYRPQTKGKVETLAKIVNRLKAYNNEFKTLEDLERIIYQLNKEINSEIHATTLETPINRFKKEKEYLGPLGNIDILEAYYSEKVLLRKVSKESLITYGNHKYSIPPKYIGKQVSLSIEDDTIHIYYNQKLIATHKISDKPINYDSKHYYEIVKSNIDDEDLIERICKENLKNFERL